MRQIPVLHFDNDNANVFLDQHNIRAITIEAWLEKHISIWVEVVVEVLQQVELAFRGRLSSPQNLVHIRMKPSHRYRPLITLME
ncbi:hypothetical protein LP419_21845 [Massilia sp. H-1]|nr:hypothetical protein LP419_21845 [Massilia sp. H-1]